MLHQQNFPGVRSNAAMVAPHRRANICGQRRHHLEGTAGGSSSATTGRQARHHGNPTTAAPSIEETKLAQRQAAITSSVLGAVGTHFMCNTVLVITITIGNAMRLNGTLSSLKPDERS